MALLGNLNIIDNDGVFSLPNDTNEHTVFELVLEENTPALLFRFNMDLTNLVQNCTVRLYYKVDGTNYRLRQGASAVGGPLAWTTADPDWVSVPIIDFVDHDIKITIQSSVAQGSVVDIPYSLNGAM